MIYANKEQFLFLARGIHGKFPLESSDKRKQTKGASTSSGTQ